jgi:hypothetical protein
VSNEDLHERLTARLQELQDRTAELADGAPFTVTVDGCTCYGGMAPYGHEPHCGTEPGDAWWVIDLLVRSIGEEREVLKRHAPDRMPSNAPNLWECEACSVDIETSCDWVHHERGVDWPCAEILSLAKRIGVTP